MFSSCATRKFANAFGFEDEFVVPPALGPVDVLPPAVLELLCEPPQPAASTASAAQATAPRCSRLQRIRRFKKTSRSLLRRPNPRPILIVLRTRHR
jgi:hypothetical protein